jgi:competence protein ComEA
LVVVDVAGRVQRPGIVTLPLGARVADALDAAGGPRGRVDLTTLNLARVLLDGEQLLVGVEPAVPPPAPTGDVPTGDVPTGDVPTGDVPGPTSGSTSSAAGSLVNLNTATEAELDTLPGVGPVTAQAILAWRTEHGSFTSVDELLEVSGIGEVTLEELRPLVTV